MEGNLNIFFLKYRYIEGSKTGLLRARYNGALHGPVNFYLCRLQGRDQNEKCQFLKLQTFFEISEVKGMGGGGGSS